MDQTPLVIDNISKKFKEKQILDKVSFTVEKNEIFGLIGLNGVGKTTMIKIMLDLLKADSGKVEFFGHNALKPLSRKNICYLPEKFYPSTYLKGNEFLELTLSYFKKNYQNKQGDLLADILELDKKMLVDKISKYSKGMSQKLGLLSVFMSKAPLLILDEPMSGLDPAARIELKELLLDYCKRGNSVFFSSHILSDIDEICHRIAVLHDKHIIFIGTPAEFKQKYQEDILERAFLKAINKEVIDLSLIDQVA